MSNVQPWYGIHSPHLLLAYLTLVPVLQSDSSTPFLGVPKQCVVSEICSRWCSTCILFFSTAHNSTHLSTSTLTPSLKHLSWIIHSGCRWSSKHVLCHQVFPSLPLYLPLPPCLYWAVCGLLHLSLVQTSYAVAYLPYISFILCFTYFLQRFSGQGLCF